MSQYGNLLYEVSTMKPSWTPTRTAMRDPAELAKSLGVTYDYDSIYNKFADATKAQYAVQRKEQEASENKYYNDMYNTQMASLDTIKKANSQAVATGASRGMQAANELSSILGLQQEAVAGATQLAADRSALADKETAALAQNAVDALTQANSTALSLGNLNANIYAADTQFDVGQMDYYARLDTAIKSLMGMQEQAMANRYGADQNLAGAMYTADKNYAAALASAAASGGGYSSGGSALSDDPTWIEQYDKGNLLTKKTMLISSGWTQEAAAKQAKNDMDKQTSYNGVFNNTGGDYVGSRSILNKASNVFPTYGNYSFANSVVGLDGLTNAQRKEMLKYESMFGGSGPSAIGGYYVP